MKRIILSIIILFFTASIAYADVQIADTKAVNSKWQFVAITLTADGDSCRYTVSTPVLEGQALTDWCNGREARYQVEIMKGLYPGARYQSSEGDTEIERFTAWIASGTINSAYCRKAEGSTQQACQEAGGQWIPEEVITKVPWVDSWSITKVTAENDMKQSVLYNKTDAQIQAYINKNVTDINSAKVFLYRLTKEVRDMIRRQGWE